MRSPVLFRSGPPIPLFTSHSSLSSWPIQLRALTAQILRRLRPLRKLEREPVLEESCRNDAAALQNEFGLRAHECAPISSIHPFAGSPNGNPAASRSIRMNSAFGNGLRRGDVDDAVDVVALDQPADRRDEVVVVDPRHELPAVAGACRRGRGERDRAACRRLRPRPGSWSSPTAAPPFECARSPPRRRHAPTHARRRC